MMADTVDLVTERQGQRWRVTARWQGAPVHADVLDPASATARQRYVRALAKVLPQVDPAAIDAELLRLVDTPDPQTGPATGDGEIDVSRIVRPELVITPEVSGIAVPVVGLTDGKPAARWVQYLRWADGRREARELAGTIDLPDASRLWVYPVPGEPSMHALVGWSAAARRAWLDGAAAPDPVDLFRRLCERLAYYLDLADDTAAGTTATLALWVVLTYVYQAWDAVPYLYIGGPMHSGKTRVLDLLGRLAYRPLASSSLTGPALFRTLHSDGGTLLYDEAERLRQGSDPGMQELVAMLLAGYRRGGKATRLEPVGDSFRPVAFDVFGPKALACIAGLPPTLASRCITVTMFRAGPDSPKPRRRIDADPAGWQRLRDDLHAVALEHGPAWLDLAQRSGVCPAGIGGRDYELWQPMLALASRVESRGAEGLLGLMQRFALATIDAGKDDTVPEADEVLLAILAEEVQAGQWPTPGEILAKAQGRDPGIFGKPDGPGPRWQPNGVTRRLKSYGIPAPRKVNGQRRYRHVTLRMLWRIQRHYGIDLDILDPDLAPESPTLTDPTDPAEVQQRRKETGARVS